MAFGRRKHTVDPAAEFTRDMAVRFRAAPQVVDVRIVEDLQLVVTTTEPSPITVFLSTIFAEAQQLAGPAREERLRSAVAGLARPTKDLKDWDAVRSSLRPAIRATSWTTASGIREIASRPFAPFVTALLAVDDPHAIAYVPQDAAERWGVSWEAAWQVSVANLLADGYQLADPVAPGTVRVVGPDGYAASWLAVPSVLEHLGQGCVGDVLAVAPHRDELWVFGSDRPDLPALLDLANRAWAEAPRQLSPVPYLVDPAGVRPWEPPAGHPARRAVELARVHLGLVEYEFQQDHLRAEAEAAGRDVFVGTFKAFEGADGAVRSRIVWVRDVTDGLLALADEVAFVAGQDDPVFVVPFDDVWALCGGTALVETGASPPRFHTRGWPPADVIAELRTRAIG